LGGRWCAARVGALLLVRRALAKCRAVVAVTLAVALRQAAWKPCQR
jgi:hypothetical protein